MENVNWQGKKVLVTGANGFVGSHLTEYLLMLGCSVTITVRDLKHESYLRHANLLDKTTTATGDLVNSYFVERIIEQHAPEYIFHLASVAEVKTCNEFPKTTFLSNIVGTLNLLETVRNHPEVKGIIIASSDKMYGDGVVPYKEDQPLRAFGVYETSKMCQDLLAQTYFLAYNVPAVILRCANIYGPGDFTMSRVIPGTIHKILHNISPVVYTSSKESVREFLYITDAVGAYTFLAENINTTVGQAFNVGGTGPVKIYDLVFSIASMMNATHTVTIAEKAKNFREIPVQYLDWAKIKSLGFSPQVSLTDGLKKTVNWYSKYYEGKKG